MNDIRKSLLQLQGKSADYITKFLKDDLGDGESMQKGLINFHDAMVDDKQRCVLRNRIGFGICGIALGAVVMFGAPRIYRYIKKRDSQSKIGKIAKILREEVAVSNIESGVDNSEVNDDEYQTDAHLIDFK